MPEKSDSATSPLEFTDTHTPKHVFKGFMKGRMGEFVSMKYAKQLCTAAWLILLTSESVAQSQVDVLQIERSGVSNGAEWRVFTGLNSSRLALEGADLITSSALTLPVESPFDGRQAIVTFWKPTQEPYLWAPLVRCIDYFDDFMGSQGGACSIPDPLE